jgi:hypothetical protein
MPALLAEQAGRAFGRPCADHGSFAAAVFISVRRVTVMRSLMTCSPTFVLGYGSASEGRDAPLQFRPATDRAM